MKEVVQEAKGIEHVVYQFKSKGDAQKAKKYFESQKKMTFWCKDEGSGKLSVEVDSSTTGEKYMDDYHNKVVGVYKPKILSKEAVEMKEKKFKLQKEAVNFINTTDKKLTEGTDFKGSKSVTITRSSGGDAGMVIQLTDKNRKFIQLPVAEAVVLGRALQDKKLMKA